MARKQTLVQLDDRLLGALDQLAAASGRSRSDHIRLALTAYLNDSLQLDDDRAIVAGYTRTPPDPASDALLDAAAIAMIEQEPW